MAKGFAFEDILNKSITDEKKKGAILAQLIEQNIVEEKYGKYVLNDAGAKSLLTDVRSGIMRASGLKGATSRVGTKNYLESIKANFYESEEVKGLTEDEKKELFDFLTSRAGGTTSGAYKDYSSSAVDGKLATVEGLGGKYPDSVAVKGLSPEAFVDMLYTDLNEYRNAILSRDASKKIKDDLVTNGTYTFEQIKEIQAEYNEHIKAHARIEEVENFFKSIGATVGKGGVSWDKSFKGFVEYERDTKTRITKRKIDTLRKYMPAPTTPFTPFEFSGGGLGGGVDAGASETPATGTHSTERGSQYIPKRRGFFARVGRWMAKHPILTSVIAVGVLAVGTLAINPVFALSYLGTGLLIGAGTVAVTSATKGIVYGASPRYRNFCYDYDIEKNFRAVSKARTKCENIINRVKSLAGHDVFAEIHEATGADKSRVANDVVTSGRINESAVNKIREIVNAKKNTINKINKSNNKKLERIANIIDKKKVNSVDLGYNTDAEKDVFVEDFTQGREFEEGRLTESVENLKDARAIRDEARVAARTGRRGGRGRHGGRGR